MFLDMYILSFSTQNHAESFRNFLKKSVLDSKRAKWEQKSDFGHVRTYSWLHKLRNTQGKMYATYLGKIYMEYLGNIVRNIHKYLWYKMIRSTGAAFGGRPIGSVFLIILYHKHVWIFLIYSLYIPYIFPSYGPYIFPCVFLNLWSPEQVRTWPKCGSNN